MVLTLGCLAVLVLGRPTWPSFLAGLPLVVAGEGLRLWASGYIVKMEELITAGPFALCRNPLYTGSFLVSAGYFAMCNRLDVWIVGTALFWLFHGGAVVYEERMLRERYGKQYDDYCASVPRFVPRLRSLSGNGHFSLSQLVTNNEYRGLVGAVLMVLLFVLRLGHVAILPAGWLVSLKP